MRRNNFNAFNQVDYLRWIVWGAHSLQNLIIDTQLLTLPIVV